MWSPSAYIPECGKTFSRWYLDRSIIQKELTQLQPCSQSCKPVSGSATALQANYHAHTAAHRIIQQILAGSLTFIGLQDPEELQPLSDYTTPSLQQHGDRRKNIGSNRKLGDKDFTVSKIFTSVSTLTSLRCIHRPQTSQHQQGPISPKRGKAPYKGLRTLPLRRSLLRHGTCPYMYCFRFELHTLDVFLVLQSAL